MLVGDGEIPGPDFDNDGQLRPAAPPRHNADSLDSIGKTRKRNRRIRQASQTIPGKNTTCCMSYHQNQLDNNSVFFFFFTLVLW